MLRRGVWLSATAMAGGLAWLAAASGFPMRAQAPAALLAGGPQAMIQAGLLLLLLTPVARVVAAGWAFLKEGERRYALVSAAVLALILAGLVLGQN